jgi:hypothetical protein
MIPYWEGNVNSYGRASRAFPTKMSFSGGRESEASPKEIQREKKDPML